MIQETVYSYAKKYTQSWRWF